MNYTEIGNTGLKLPPIVFGTSALGNLYVALEEDIKLEIIREAFRYVENPVFDCAGKYGAGLALEMLGKCLQKLQIDPGKVIISNKLGWKRKPLTTAEPVFEPGVWRDLKYDAVQDISYNGIISCWEQGNELLGGKYKPRLVSVHDPDEYINQGITEKEKETFFENILDAYRALNVLKKEGKVKAVGVGAKDWRTIQKICGLVDLDWVMFANSMTIMNHPVELIRFMEQLRDKGIMIINSAVFQAGFLIGGDYYDYRKIEPDSPENIRRFEWRKVFFELCSEFNVKPSEACVNFAIRAPGVCSISLNTSKPEHVKENVDSVSSSIPQELYINMKNRGLIEKHCNFL